MPPRYVEKTKAEPVGLSLLMKPQLGESAEVLLLVTCGIGLGLCGYAGAAVWIRRVLFEVHPWEPIAVVSALLLIGLVTAIAAAPATYRAVRIDPATALRLE